MITIRALCRSFSFSSLHLQHFFLLTDLDKFAADDIMDPIAKAKMVALKGIKRVLAQDPMVVPPGINRYFLLSIKLLKHDLECFCFKSRVEIRRFSLCL